MKKIKYVFAASALLLGLSGTAFAASLIGPDKNDPNVVVSASESFKNLYTAGSNVTINSPVKGDLTTAGGMVSLVGDIEQDALILGGTLNLAGRVGGDVRILGGNITFSAPISGDVVGAGGNVNFTQKTSIGGDLVFAGGNIYLDAPVKGSVSAAGGNININNVVEGDVRVMASQQLVFGPNAQVMGKIVLKSPRQALVKEGAKISAIEYTKTSPRNYKNGFRAIASIGFVVKILAMFIAAWLLLYLRRHKVLEALESIHAKPMAALGWGLVGLFVTPVVIVLLFITFVGYYVAFAVLVWYALMLIIACLLASLLVGKTALKYLNKAGNYTDWQLALIGVLIFKLLSLIPVLGWVVVFAASLMAIGQMTLLAKESFKRQ